MRNRDPVDAAGARAPGRPRRLAAVSASLALAVVAPAVSGERLRLRHVTLDLPGPPSKVVPADLDGDGRNDLVVVVAYSEVGRIGNEEEVAVILVTPGLPRLVEETTRS